MTKHPLPDDANNAADQDSGGDQKRGLRSTFALTALTALDAGRALKLARGFTNYGDGFAGDLSGVAARIKTLVNLRGGNGRL